jgi:hypothetical protein
MGQEAEPFPTVLEASAGLQRVKRKEHDLLQKAMPDCGHWLHSA